MAYKFTLSVHKGNCSESHLGHNRRTIFVPHADKDRLHLDEAIIDEKQQSSTTEGRNPVARFPTTTSILKRNTKRVN